MKVNVSISNSNNYKQIKSNNKLQNKNMDLSFKNNKVKDIETKIANNTYKVDLNLTANSMLKELI